MPVIPMKPPGEWFDDPDCTHLTAIRVLDTGRVYGHFAEWGACHLGYHGECVTPPHSATDYAWFLTGELETAEGEMVRVGKLTMDGPHADLTKDYRQAARHYDDSTTAVADIAVGEDGYGPWFAGALRPGVTDEQIRRLRNQELSGDWRPCGYNRELTAILAVNSGGFKVPRVAVAASGRSLGSVGLGMVRKDGERSALVASVLRADLVARTLE